RVYGLTFIDDREGAVFNGSDLGKQYSGQALIKRFNDLTPGERERNERVDRGFEVPQFKRYDSQANGMQGIAQEFFDLMKAGDHYSEPANPYLKRKKKKKKRGRSL